MFPFPAHEEVAHDISFNVPTILFRNVSGFSFQISNIGMNHSLYRFVPDEPTGCPIILVWSAVKTYNETIKARNIGHTVLFTSILFIYSYLSLKMPTRDPSP